MRGQVVELRVSTVQGGAAAAPPSTRRLGDGALLAAKVGVLCCGALALLAAHLSPPLVRRVHNHARGVSMRLPAGWTGYDRFEQGVVAFKRDGRFNASVTVWRFSWCEFDSARETPGTPVPARQLPTDLVQAAAEVAACLGFPDATGRAHMEGAVVGGRPALVLVAPRYSTEPWRAIAVAAGEDLLFLDLRAASEADLRAVWRCWKAMIRSVRVTNRPRPMVERFGCEDGCGLEYVAPSFYAKVPRSAFRNACGNAGATADA